MPKHALPPQHRIRTAAIGKKGGLESAMLMESELVVTTKMNERHADNISASPTTIAASFDGAIPMMKPLPGALEAMKPLPGAWMVVGKGGRPLKDGVMYDAPSQKKKKKKRNRAHKTPGSDDDVSNVLADFAEVPSTSTCEQTLHRSTMRRQKEVGKKKELKYWLQYRQDKATKVLARDTLIYLLEGMDGEEMGAPEPLIRHHDKGSSLGAKLRRKARFAAAAARCYSAEEFKEPEWTETPPLVDKRKPSEARATATAEHSASMAGVAPAGMSRDSKPPQSCWKSIPTWTTVSYRKAKRDSKKRPVV